MYPAGIPMWMWLTRRFFRWPAEPFFDPETLHHVD